MTKLCDRVHEFVDGELSEADADAFRDHLATCSACEAELTDALVLAALADDVAVSEASHKAADVVPLAWYRRKRVIVAAPLLMVAAAAVILFMRRPSSPGGATEVILALAPNRSIEGRVGWAGGDAHRPYDVMRAGDQQQREPITLAQLAALEKSGDLQGVAAAYLLSGEWDRANEYLDKLPDSPGVRADRALVLIGKGEPGAALIVLDEALEKPPKLAAALWNRAVALRDMKLPLGAARAFDAVAELGEPGWSDEARSRAEALRAAVDHRRQASYNVVSQAQAWIREGTELPADFALHDPGLARGFFYDLVRAAPSRERVESLRTVAAELDRVHSTKLLSAYVERVAKADFRVRGPLALRYGKLVMGETLSTEEHGKLRRELRKAGLGDILMGALLRDDSRIGADEIQEYSRLAQEFADPWFVILALEMNGRNLREAADYPGAEAALLAGRAACESSTVAFRCGRIAAGLGELYIMLNRVAASSDVLTGAREQALRNGDWFLQEQTTRQIAMLPAIRDDSHGSYLTEARALMEEAVWLRPGDCERREFSDRHLASLYVDQLRFDEALSQLTSGLAGDADCPQPVASVARAFVVAQIVSATGDDELAREQLTAIRDMRQQPMAVADDRIALDYVEGRVLLASDRAAGETLLRAAIDKADTLAHVGVDGRRLRAYSYSVLVLEAARNNEYGRALYLIGEELGVRVAKRCVLGVAIEAELAVIAIGSDGETFGAYRRLSSPDYDVDELVPVEFLDRLRTCEVVDVYARPPILGQAQLLPISSAWRYRVARGQPRKSAPAFGRLVVADVEPPSKLRFSRLSAGVSHGTRDTVYLSGAAATPNRVREAMRRASEIEIHAHGVVDGGGDAAWIALSPGKDGYALTANEVAATPLLGAPVVYLAACHGARSTKFFDESWSLAFAFARAGARAVIGSTKPIPDAGAAEFFAAVRQRMSHGASAAEAVRSVRTGSFLDDDDNWMRYVIVFE